LRAKRSEGRDFFRASTGGRVWRSRYPKAPIRERDHGRPTSGVRGAAKPDRAIARSGVAAATLRSDGRPLCRAKKTRAAAATSGVVGGLGNYSSRFSGFINLSLCDSRFCCVRAAVTALPHSPVRRMGRRYYTMFARLILALTPSPWLGEGGAAA
jgi:hypothetical protein